MTYNAHPFQLLEINVISGQDLAPVSKSMRTYAVVWVHPGRKLSTKVDQNGHTNPQWNEKIVFRVDDTFINAENSSIMIEIYAAAWLRDVQIGSVNVLISNLFPSHNNSNKMRFVALQVRRPSGRPQGILNLGVQLLDSTMRSMPLYTELSVSAVGLDHDLIDEKTIGQSLEEKSAKLRRSQSDQTDQTISDKSGVKESGARSHGGSLINSKTVKRDNGNVNGNGSMINGSLCSDVGPSASVVAAAIAKGLIKTPANAVQHYTEGGKSSVLEDWTENDSIEGLRTKLERWRADLPPNHDSDHLRKMQSKSLRKKYRRRTDGGGLFTCFGFGCEISITWGEGNNKKRNGNRKVCHVSSVDSQSYL